MAALRKGCLFQTTWMVVRHRGKINIRHPVPGPWPRRILEVMSKPIVLRDLDIMKTPAQKCAEWRAKNVKVVEENPWEEFLVRRCKELFHENRMVAVFQALPSKHEEKRTVNNKLMKKGMRLLHYPNEVVLRAIGKSKYQNIGQLFVGENLLVIGKEVNLPDLVKIMRKVPHMALLAALVDDRILSREEITRYASLPPLESVRGELVAILGSPASKTQRLLSSQYTTLSRNLEQLIKQQSEPEEKTENSSES